MTAFREALRTAREAFADRPEIGWDVDYNRRLPRPYRLSSDSLIAGTTPGGGGMYVLTAAKPFIGDYVGSVTITFEREVNPYQTASIISDERKEYFRTHDYGSDFRVCRQLFEAMRAGREITLFIDMQSRTCIDSLGNTFTNLPDRVWLAVSMKNSDAPARCTITRWD